MSPQFVASLAELFCFVGAIAGFFAGLWLKFGGLGIGLCTASGLLLGGLITCGIVTLIKQFSRK
jgi:hypothetical protein